MKLVTVVALLALAGCKPWSEIVNDCTRKGGIMVKTIGTIGTDWTCVKTEVIDVK